MNKTIKKLLISLLLVITVCLLKSTYSFGYIVPEKQAFETFTKKQYKAEYNLYLGEKMYATDWSLSWYLKPTITISDSKVVGIENEKELKAKKVGSTNVKIAVTYEGKTITKNFKINVSQTKENTKLDSKTNDVITISQNVDAKNQVLLANSELWNAKDKTYKLTTKKTGNVAKYVYSGVYRDEKGLRVESTLKKDGNLTIKFPKMTKKSHTYNGADGKKYTYYTYTSTKTIKSKKVSKVKEISSFGYLTNNGKFYFYTVDKNGVLKVTKKMTGVNKILSDYVLTKKGKTYAISGIKICDFEAIQVDNSSSCYNGMLLDKKGNLYYYYYDYGYEYDSVNNKSTKVRKERYVTKKVESNVKKILGDFKYQAKNGKTKRYEPKDTHFSEDLAIQKRLYLYTDGVNNELTLKDNNKVYLNNVNIINKVDDIYYTDGTKNKSALIVRKDGSIWRLDIGGKKPNLTKVRSGKDKDKKISKPSNLKATQSGKNKAKVKWSKVEGAKKYTIYRSTSKNGKYKKVATSKTNSFKDTKLKKGQKYYYKIVANYSDTKYDSEMSSAVKIKLAK